MSEYKHPFFLTFLGTRGSVPVDGRNFQVFGGATSCVRVLAGGHELYLDAGSGMVSAAVCPDTDLHVLITHPHLDHLTGLPFFSGLSKPGRSIDIRGFHLTEALKTLYQAPFWPCTIHDYPAKVTVSDVAAGDVLFYEKNGLVSCANASDDDTLSVHTMLSNHPGGSLVYRIFYRSASFVYATDFEHSDDAWARLAEFAKGADLLLYDAQYFDDEYERKQGYGHSTAAVGLSVAKAANVKQLIFTHHDPQHTDDLLLSAETAAKKEAASYGISASFARVNDTIRFF